MPHGPEPGVGLGLLGLTLVVAFTVVGLWAGHQMSGAQYKPDMIGWYIVKALEK